MSLQVALRYKLRKLYRFLKPKRIRNYGLVRRFVSGKQGVEIGGPSKIFNDIIKVYGVADRIDGCNFNSSTIWEGNIRDGGDFKYAGQKLGTQLINDATDLKSIANDAYDFLLSSHCLEHVANPIKAFGSEIFKSPRVAKLAETPPMQGSTITDRYGSPKSESRPNAAEVLAICINDIKDSCIRAPPLQEKQTNGILWVRQVLTA